jgi:hypothetical protein
MIGYFPVVSVNSLIPHWRRFSPRRSSTISAGHKPLPHAACVVTLVDRLLHRAELITVEGDSFRLKEAKDRAATTRARRPRRKDNGHDHPAPPR